MTSYEDIKILLIDILNKNNNQYDIKININYVFLVSCCNNFIDIIIKLIKEICIDDDVIMQGINFACRSGNLNIMKLLINKYKNKIDIHYDNEILFTTACYVNVNINIMKYLISLEKEYGKINIHIKNEYCFYVVCMLGYENKLKYLLALQNDHGKINLNNDLMKLDFLYQIDNINVSKILKSIGYEF